MEKSTRRYFKSVFLSKRGNVHSQKAPSARADPEGEGAGDPDPPPSEISQKI